jgi:hypothetical protein
MGQIFHLNIIFLYKIISVIFAIIFLNLRKNTIIAYDVELCIAMVVVYNIKNMILKK